MEGFYYQFIMAVDKIDVTTQMSYSLMTNEASCSKTQRTAHHRNILLLKYVNKEPESQLMSETLRQELEIICIIQPHPTQLEFVW